MDDRFTCYLDESGDAKDPKLHVMAMGGLIGAADAWSTFAKDWQALLDAEQIHVFHMTDCEGKRGEFAGWTSERRDNFLRTIMQYLTSLPVAFVGLTVHTGEMAPIRKRFGKGSAAYYYLFQLLVDRTAGVITTIPPGPVVMDVVAAEHPDFSGWLRSGYENLRRTITSGNRLGSLTVESPKNVLPLQAADLVAYETFKNRTNQLIHGKSCRPRWQMLEFGKTGRHMIIHANVNWWGTSGEYRAIAGS